MHNAPDSPFWEYQVIHLNVNESVASAAQKSTADPGLRSEAAAEPQAQPATLADQPGIGVFSREYLEHEFPDFYGRIPVPPAPAPVAAAVAHPAQQLQTFLNRCGEQGWLLIGVFPIGSLQMLILRRPRSATAVPAAAPVQALDQLASILQRLEALESTGRSLTTAEAACALGFSSISPLSNALRRMGLAEGLQVQGANGKSAEYLGLGVPASGGRRCRLWRVVPPSGRLAHTS